MGNDAPPNIIVFKSGENLKERVGREEGKFPDPTVKGREGGRRDRESPLYVAILQHSALEG